MYHLKRMLRLLAVSMLVVFGSFTAVPVAAGDEIPRPGIDYQSLVKICERFQGRFHEGDLQEPYRYGCELSDGEINCLETTECAFYGPPRSAAS